MDKNEIDAYRQAIVALVVSKSAHDEDPGLTQEEAEALVANLSDSELADGMPWNTPEEVADLLLESGL
jgi:hypothetical protein